MFKNVPVYLVRLFVGKIKVHDTRFEYMFTSTSLLIVGEDRVAINVSMFIHEPVR